jgi:hypothetical protein
MGIKGSPSGPTSGLGSNRNTTFDRTWDFAVSLTYALRLQHGFDKCALLVIGSFPKPFPPVSTLGAFIRPTAIG